jgi:hypothetical protein
MNESSMSQKKKQKRFSAVKAVKALARERVGAPPPVRKEEGTKRQGKEKHKSTLGKLLQESE